MRITIFLLLLFLVGCIPLSQMLGLPEAENTIGNNIDRIIENPPSNRTEWIIALLLVGASVAGYCTKRYIDNYYKPKPAVATIPAQTPAPSVQIASFLEPRRQAEIVKMQDHLDERFDGLEEKLSSMKITFDSPNGIEPHQAATPTEPATPGEVNRLNQDSQVTLVTQEQSGHGKN